jgi:hypothetical protein
MRVGEWGADEAPLGRRAPWLVALLRSVREAQQIALELGADAGNPEVQALHRRLSEIEVELEAMRRAEPYANGELMDPFWSLFSRGWDEGA